MTSSRFTSFELVILLLSISLFNGTSANIDNEQPTLNPLCPPNEDPWYATLLPNPNNCQMYYKCSYGYAFSFSCPKGKQWNAAENICQYSSVVDCGTRADNSKVSEVNQPVLNPLCPTDEDPWYATYLPNPNDCQKYFKCSYGYAYPNSCPSGKQWNVAENICQYSSVVDCGTRPDNSNTTASDQPLLHPLCPTEEAPLYPTYLPNPYNFQKYYKCSNGFAFPYSCPNGKEWSVAHTNCKDPYIAKCNISGENTDETTDEPLPLNPLCPFDDDPWNQSTYLPHPKDCGKYYICFYGQAEEMTCQQALHWNSALNKCDSPAESNCGKNNDISSTSTTEQPESSTSEEPDIPSSTSELSEPTTNPSEEPETYFPTSEQPALSSTAPEKPEALLTTTEQPESLTSEEPDIPSSTSELPEPTTNPSEEPATYFPTSEQPAISSPTSEQSEASLTTTEQPESLTSEKPELSSSTSELPEPTINPSEEPETSLPTSEQPVLSSPTSEQSEASLTTTEQTESLTSEKLELPSSASDLPEPTTTPSEKPATYFPTSEQPALPSPTPTS